MENKKEELKKMVQTLLDESYEAMCEKIDKAINCGAINIDEWDGKYILPKTILCAILEDEVRQYDGRGTSFEKEVKKDKNNLKAFL